MFFVMFFVMFFYVIFCLIIKNIKSIKITNFHEKSPKFFEKFLQNLVENFYFHYIIEQSKLILLQ